MGASCTCYATVSPVVMETKTVIRDGSPEKEGQAMKTQPRKTSRFKRRSELSVASDENPHQVYLIHLSAVLLNPRDCPQLVDFILDKPVIMVEIGVVVDKAAKSLGPRKIIMEPEIDWDGLDITQQVPRRVSLSDGTARVYGVLTRTFNCQIENEKVTLNALLLGQKKISLTTDIQDDKEYSLRDVTDMFKCFMAENNGSSKKSSTIRKVSISGEVWNPSDEQSAKDPDTDSRSSRLISAYLADDSYRAGKERKEIVRKVSIEEKVLKYSDKDRKISSATKEEKIRTTPPDCSSGDLRRRTSLKSDKQRRHSCDEKKKSREEKKKKNSKEDNFSRRHSSGEVQRRKTVRKVTPYCKVLITEPSTCCSKEPGLSELQEEDERKRSTATDRSDFEYASTCSLPRRISSSIGYSPLPGWTFDPITELSCEEDEGDRKRRDKQRSVSFT